MRPRRSLRRLLSRARFAGRPHVHCPTCGGDNALPDDGSDRVCPVCGTRSFRVELSGDLDRDLTAIAARVGSEAWSMTLRPVLLESPDGAGVCRPNPTAGIALVYRPPPA